MCTLKRVKGASQLLHACQVPAATALGTRRPRWRWLMAGRCLSRQGRRAETSQGAAPRVVSRGRLRMRRRRDMRQWRWMPRVVGREGIRQSGAAGDTGQHQGLPTGWAAGTLQHQVRATCSVVPSLWCNALPGFELMSRTCAAPARPSTAQLAGLMESPLAAKQRLGPCKLRTGGRGGCAGTQCCQHACALVSSQACITLA